MVDFVLLAAGRGNTPGLVSGIAIVLGVVIAVAILGFVGHLLLHRFGRTRPETQERRPQRPGRVGRISKQEGP